MLFDSDGNPMTPTHAVKEDTPYLYYVPRPLIIKDHTERSIGLRIPAAEVGRQPPDLTADKLLAHSRQPLAWHEQRTMLGFA
jgi:hypothetical protein